MWKKSKGQSVLEYVIMLALIIAAIIVFSKGALTTKIGTSLNHAADQMELMTNRINFE
jgi:hypothetical protein